MDRTIPDDGTLRRHGAPVPIALAVHGGAWEMPLGELPASRRGCVAAVDAGYELLAAGGGALDAVERAIVVLEDDPAFDAGRGAVLNEIGEVELDAGIMRGADASVGAVAAVSRVRNPVRLARHVLDCPETMMVGHAADELGEQLGLECCGEEWFVVERERLRWHDLRQRRESASDYLRPAASPSGTVGAVALDTQGCIVAATSTGGLPLKPRGRVGDTPIPGAGFFAADGRAGVSVTGHGEAFVRLLWSYRAVELAGGGLAAQTACETAVELLASLAAHGGLVMVDGAGRPGVAFNTTRMAFAHRTRDGGLVTC